MGFPDEYKPLQEIISKYAHSVTATKIPVLVDNTTLYLCVNYSTVQNMSFI